MKKFDIEETVDVFDFAIFGLEETIKNLSDDGQIDSREWIETCLKAPEKLFKAVVGVDKVDDELRDLDPEEMKVLATKGVIVARLVLQLFIPSKK